jgi:hypothetical protein
VSAARRAADGASGRVIVHDDRGVRWEVSERDAAHVPGARGPRCLVFMSDSAVRRVWTYPPTWRLLSAAALLAVSERA